MEISAENYSVSMPCLRTFRQSNVIIWLIESLGTLSETREKTTTSVNPQILSGVLELCEVDRVTDLEMYQIRERKCGHSNSAAGGQV